MIEIKVLSNRSAERKARKGELKDSCWILSWFDRDWSQKPLKRFARHYLCLHYADISDKDLAKRLGLPYFDDRDAKRVVSLVERALDQGVTRIVFSCDAGISRSAAMAEAFFVWLESHGIRCRVKYEKFPHPNTLVKSELLKKLRQTLIPQRLKGGVYDRVRRRKKSQSREHCRQGRY